MVYVVVSGNYNGGARQISNLPNKHYQPDAHIVANQNCHASVAFSSRHVLNLCSILGHMRNLKRRI